METRSNYFACIVAGDKPEELIKKYDSSIKVNPYIKYKYSDAHKLKEAKIQFYTAIEENDDISDEIKAFAQEEIQDLKEMSDNEFFEEITSEYTHDKEGNAISTENPDGKYSFHTIGKIFSNPFLLKDGRETFQAKKSDIDWDKVNGKDSEIYQIAWEMVMEGKKPETEFQQTIYDNMKHNTEYFKKFGTKENYVISSTAFWGYAFLSDMTGWQELEADMSQFVWVKNFFDMFIKPLPEDTLLTIYECKR